MKYKAMMVDDELNMAENAKHFSDENSPVDKITVPDQIGDRVVKVADLIFLQADSHYTILHISDMNVIVSNQPLDEFERILADGDFFRINKSTIINLNYVNASSGGDDEKTVTLITGEKLMILGKRMPEFRKAMLRYPK